MDKTSNVLEKIVKIEPNVIEASFIDEEKEKKLNVMLKTDVLSRFYIIDPNVSEISIKDLVQSDWPFEKKIICICHNCYLLPKTLILQIMSQFNISKHNFEQKWSDKIDNPFDKISHLLWDSLIKNHKHKTPKPGWEQGYYQEALYIKDWQLRWEKLLNAIKDWVLEGEVDLNDTMENEKQKQLRTI